MKTVNVRTSVANNLNGEGKPLAEGRKVTGYLRALKINHLSRDPLSAELFAKTVVEELTKK